MVVKEAEAPDYRCPQAMASDASVYCRGSRCMAWRWADKGDRYFDAALQAWASKPDLSTTHGYCGLAGRP